MDNANKVKVGLVGKVLLPEEAENFRTIQAQLSKLEEVEIISLDKKANEIVNSGDIDTRQQLFDMAVNAIEESDFLIILEPNEIHLKSGVGFLYWNIGYAWANGIPTAILSDKSGKDAFAGVITASSLHAHFTSVEEMLGYDFVNKPYIPYQGTVVY